MNRRQVITVPLFAILICILSTCSCEKKTPQPVTVIAAKASQPAKSPPETSSSEQNEIIWAGIAGNMPDFIDSGIDQGLGFMELQTKPIRKALAAAGFKVRYEYFSPGRIAHEFSKNTPICFYPTEWRDPKKTFEKAQDRIYSVALDFRGEEARSIIIRKRDEPKFKQFRSPDGSLKLQALLEDPGFKTVFPKTDGLGPEFDQVYSLNKDGSFEINSKYRHQITSRRLHENDQLVQMLNGGSVDYLLEHFVIPEDYQVVDGGRSGFSRLNYESHPIQSLSDPQVILSSVTCSLSETSQRAMPIINSVIRRLRGGAWSGRNLDLRRGSGIATQMRIVQTLAYRFASDLLGKVDEWLPLQNRFFPAASALNKQNINNSEEILRTTELSEELRKKTSPRPSTWLLIQETPQSIWILPKSDVSSLTDPLHKTFQFYLKSAPGVNCTFSSQNALWQKQHKILSALAARDSHSGLGGAKVQEGSIRELLQKLGQNQGELASISIAARGISPEETSELLSTLKARKLESVKRFELLSSSHNLLKQMLPLIPQSVENLNLWGSNLSGLELNPVISRLPELRKLNLACASIDSEDLFNSLMALPQKMENIQIGHQVLVWTPERANQFGRKLFPNLEVLDLEYSSLDDRHCGLFRNIPSSLREFNLSGNDLTSDCLQTLFDKPFLKLESLGLHAIRVSSRSILTIPPNVQFLELSYVLQENTLPHIRLPKQLKALVLGDSIFGPNQIEELAKHLHPHMTVLDLSNSKNIDSRIFEILSRAGVQEIDRLRLNNIHLFKNLKNITESVKQGLGAIKIRALGIQNTRLTNSVLEEIVAVLDPHLREINLEQNFISTPVLVHLINKFKNLDSLSINQIVDLDLKLIAPHLPSSLQELDIGNNEIGDNEIEELIFHLPPKLNHLNLRSSNFTHRGAKALIEALAQGKLQNLDYLFIDAPNLTPLEWELLVSYLPNDLTLLDIGQTTLRESLFPHLPTRLAYLNMIKVRANTTPARFAKWIQSLPRGLSTLRLYGSIKLDPDDGGVHPSPEVLAVESLWDAVLASETEGKIADTFISALASRHLDVTLNDSLLAEKSILALLSQKPRRLRHVHISKARITSEVLAAISKNRPFSITLQNTKFAKGSLSALTPAGLQMLKCLVLNGSNLPTHKITAFLRTLPPAMFILNLQGTPFTYSDVDSLLAALPRDLVFLNLMGTKVGPHGIEKIEKYFSQKEARTGFRTRLLID